MNWHKHIILTYAGKHISRSWDIQNLFKINKERLTIFLTFSALILAFFNSANVSFTWSLGLLGPILSCALLIVAMLISNSQKQKVFTRRDFLLPMIVCILLYLYLNTMEKKNVLGYTFSFFYIFIYFAILRLDARYYQRLSNCICKVLATFLIVSIAAFFLHLLGANLPHRSASWADWYFYTDYYLFLLDDRYMQQLFPRFHSIFLEPGHMGTILVLLLATQIGHWKRWYNLVMMFAMLISFSLAAYGLFVILIFIRMWVLNRHVVRNAIIAVAALAAIVGGSFVYKQGDNMLNQLIVLRFALNETGDDIVGNNRVSHNLEAEYQTLIHSSDILFGRGKWVDEESVGNAGYKLFLYEYGIAGFLLVALFYLLSFADVHNKRLYFITVVFALVNFWIRAYPLWFAFYIPYFLMVHQHIDTSTYDTCKPTLSRHE